ncbi:kynureninase [Natronococcus pandeyae]|uniref:Kynureninase n=1 Tax=Natronococcus pandeyae TaxID=2055836 RepID=A0A8J8Q8H8_9EURY|nr:kynureninase [Natronococcus pandeyae]TYL40473.1 kynureninase [Natronococcus pandeyae]
MDTSRAGARERDAADPLAAFADRFDVPGLYMDGNSLGPISQDAERTLDRVREEWRERAIGGWTDGDPPWFEYAEALGDRLAPLVGADSSEVVVANSTTVNIHTLIDTFLEDGTVVVNELDFPTDHYAIRAQLRRRGLDPDEHLVVVESRDGRTIDADDVIDALSEDVDVLFMPSVLYRSGQLFDLERLTSAAHDHGALAGFDLAHSVGVVDHALGEIGVDFAVWCHYKYCNAGPGAPAGLYVAERHFDRRPALPGWWGHEKETQFELRQTYTPAPDAGAYQIGTPPVLAMAPLEGALETIEAAGIEAIRENSLELTEYLISLADERLPECTVGTPREPARRGGHVALEHPDAYGVCHALKERDVVVDFRPPNVIRVCPSPLYTSFEDVYRVVEEFVEVLEEGEYEGIEPKDADVT